MTDSQLLEAIGQMINPLKEDIMSLKEDMTSVKEDVMSLKGDVTSLKEDMASVKEEVTDLKLDVYRLRRRIDDVDLQVKQSEITLKNEMHQESKLLLDEIERVHSILDNHAKDMTKHTA